jgi:DoxX
MRYLGPNRTNPLCKLIFVTAAPRHFTHEGAQHAREPGLLVAGLLAPISGVMALLGGMSVALGYKTRWGAWLLAAFLVPVTLTMHAFWRLQDPARHSRAAGDVRRKSVDAWLLFYSLNLERDRLVLMSENHNSRATCKTWTDSQRPKRIDRKSVNTA